MGTIKLSLLQQTFALNVGKLLVWIPTNEGWSATLGEAHRTGAMAHLYALGSGRTALAAMLRLNGYPALGDEVAKITGFGRADSIHIDRLGIDLNLFIRGEYQQTTPAYAPLGVYWHSLHPLNRWGGAWSDGNHFSMEYGGRK